MAIKQIALATLLGVGFGAAAHTQEATLPLEQGIYVDVGVRCEDVSNANSISFWGDRLNSAHIVGHIDEVSERAGSYLVTLDLEGDGGMGGNLRERVEWTVAVAESRTLTIENDAGETTYRWCAPSMDDLMRQEAQARPPLPEAPLELPDDAPEFMGRWGWEDGVPENCSPNNLTTYKANEVETMESLAVYDSDSYSEISPGHWRIEAQGVYESQRFPLTYDLYVEGDTMREVITGEDGRSRESSLVRCGD